MFLAKEDAKRLFEGLPRLDPDSPLHGIVERWFDSGSLNDEDRAWLNGRIVIRTMHLDEQLRFVESWNSPDTLTQEASLEQVLATHLGSLVSHQARDPSKHRRKRCLVCGSRFYASGNDTNKIYCSDKCKEAARRQRNSRAREIANDSNPVGKFRGLVDFLMGEPDPELNPFWDALGLIDEDRQIDPEAFDRLVASNEDEDDTAAILKAYTRAKKAQDAGEMADHADVMCIIRTGRKLAPFVTSLIEARHVEQLIESRRSASPSPEANRKPPARRKEE